MNSKLLNLILALLIYLPTCIYIPLNLYFLLFAITLFINREFLKDFFVSLFKEKKIIDKNFALILLFTLFALILRLTDLPNWESIKDFYSFAYLFPLTYIIARTLKGRNDIFKYFIYFILIELTVSIIEYALGVNTLFHEYKRFRTFDSYDLLYFTRTYGLSPNSSGLSFKYIYGLILLDIVGFSKRKTIIIELLFLIGSVFTFGRIALVVVFFYLILRLLDILITKKRFELTKQIPFILIFIFFAANPTWTTKQFTRNGTIVNQSKFDEEELEENDLTKEEMIKLTKKFGLDKLDMSGRNEIWNTFLTYSSENIQFGNKGKKLLFGRYHAHNSYIEFLASFGIYLFIFFAFIFLRNISSNNYVYLLTLGLLAMGQYLIFWGVSFFDIIFYYLIFFYKKDENT